MAFRVNVSSSSHISSITTDCTRRCIEIALLSRSHLMSEFWQSSRPLVSAVMASLNFRFLNHSFPCCLYAWRMGSVVNCSRDRVTKIERRVSFWKGRKAIGRDKECRRSGWRVKFSERFWLSLMSDTIACNSERYMMPLNTWSQALWIAYSGYMTDLPEYSNNIYKRV